MTDFAPLDVAIGLIFLILLVSSLSSIALEALASTLNWRGKDLQKKLGAMLNDPTFTGLAHMLTNNPRIKAFAQVLMDAGIVTTIRKTRGDDIDAACGQLAGEVQDRTRLQERTQKMAEYQQKYGKNFGRIVEITS